MSRPVKKIMSPVEAYLDDRGSRKVASYVLAVLCLHLLKIFACKPEHQEPVGSAITCLFMLTKHTEVITKQTSYKCLVVASS